MPDDWRIEVDEQEDRGHRWQRIYYRDELAGVRCAHCQAQPVEVLTVALAIAPCHGAIGAMLRSFL